MSKERLERAVGFNKTINDYYFLHNDRRAMQVLEQMFQENLIDFLIEQTERVRELEDVLYQDPRQEVLEGMYEENKLYLYTINAMQQILKDAIHSLDVGEKVQGMEYGVKIASEALEGEEKQ